MAEFTDMLCRDCGQVIAPRVRSVAELSATARHARWNFVCANAKCGVLYSNAKNERTRTKIYPRKELNIPAEVRTSLDDVLGQSLNVKNRVSKAAKFAYETSEDALIWTTIRYLQNTGQVYRVFGLPQNEIDSVLLWGADCFGDKRGNIVDALRRELIEVLGERPDSLTEPDVVFLAGGWLVFVEVKYRSVNSVQSGYVHFDRYLAGAKELFAVEPARIKADGYYELVRNWVAGSALARTLGKQLVLVNLTGDGCATSAARFAESLKQTPDRIFRHVTWPALLGRLEQPLEPWFATYLQTKGLLSIRGQ